MQISLGLGIGIAVALALIVGVVTRFATISSLKNNADSKIGNAEARRRTILRKRPKNEELNCNAMKKECLQKKSLLIKDPML